MRVGLISCIHANLAALEAVLRDAQDSRCDTIVCLGDIVGYFDHPSECVDLVRTNCSMIVKGNYDETCSESDSLRDFSQAIADNIEWTRKELSPAARKWLGALPYSADIRGFSIVHATLEFPRRWQYIFNTLDAAAHFTKQTKPICFFGHTHMPYVFHSKDGSVSGGPFTTFSMDPAIKYLVNVGSVGQPRDGTTDATYVIYDEAEGVVELRRIDYPRPPSGGVGAGRPLRGGSGPRDILQAGSELPKDR
jgi:predicted phosphodiesterase